MKATVYKQVNELTNDDIDEYPVWEFLSEDNSNAKDECTIKGYKHGWDKIKSTIIVKSKFELKDGTIYFGLAAPEKKFSSSQPVIISKNKHIHFWHGIIKPSSKEINNYYKDLSKKPEEVFPIKWSFENNIGEINNGVINGFGYYNNIADSFEDKVQLIK